MVFDSIELAEAYQDTWSELQAVDLEQGTRLAAVFHAATIRYPELAEVVIQPADDDLLQETGALPEAFCQASADAIVIVLPTNPTHYQPFIDGMYQSRLAKAKSHIQAVTGNVGLPDVMNAVAAHELWHGYESIAAIQTHGYEGATQLLTEQHQAALAALPLGMATSDALSMWSDENSGYKQRLHDDGLDEAAFGMLLANNVSAYNTLPSEMAADNFSYELMVAIYSQ